MTPPHDRTHGHFTVSRVIASTPATVWPAWRAWAEADSKPDGFVQNDGPGWTLRDHSLDFTVDGRERGAWVAEAPGQSWNGVHVNESVYLDIHEPDRIVHACTMAQNGAIHSASPDTLGVAPVKAETRLTVTEQIALSAPGYGGEGRVDGWNKRVTSFENLLS